MPSWRVLLLAVIVALILVAPAFSQTPFTCPHRVAWEAEPDVTGYEVSWGPLPGAYRRSVYVLAPEAEATINVAHGTSYVAVRAFNAERWASAYSEPVMVACDIGSERVPQRITVAPASVVLRG
jgi:hypothetical protein